jgi:drug/metabolite transporter (DMT)-like permease
MTRGPTAEMAQPAVRLRANVALLAMALIWAINFSVAKDALSRVPPLAFNALRFPLAALVVTIALWRGGGFRLPAREDRWRLIVLGVLGNLAYQLFFVFGLSRSRAGTASLILAGTPMVTALLGAVTGRERVAPRVWWGIGLTVIGIALVVVRVTPEPGSGNSRLGALLMFAATVSWSAYSLWSRDLIRRYGSLPVTAWTLWPGTLAIVLAGTPAAAALDLSALGPRDWIAIVYAGAMSIGVAYMLWSYGVRHLGATRTSAYANVTPVLALLAAWLLLADRPTAFQLIGALVIIGGITLAQSPEPDL